MRDGRREQQGPLLYSFAQSERQVSPSWVYQLHCDAEGYTITISRHKRAVNHFGRQSLVKTGPAFLFSLTCSIHTGRVRQGSSTPSTGKGLDSEACEPILLTSFNATLILPL
jgi:hypothetical protein